MKKKWMALLLAGVICMGCLAGCAGGAMESTVPSDSTEGVGETTESTGQEEATEPAVKGALILATSADYPPFEFHVLDESGKDVIVGLDVALAKKIAEDMNLELQILDMSFENLMAAMQKGEADIVIAAIEQDGERDKVVDFSDPYYTDYPPMILVKKENAEQYKSLDDFSGKTVGAQNATTKAELVTEQMPGATLLGLSSVLDLVNNLVYDKCDAIVLDGAVAQQYAQSNENLVVLDAISLGEVQPYRVAVQKGDPKGLLASINQTIAAVLADGTMDAYVQEANEQSSQAQGE